MKAQFEWKLHQIPVCLAAFPRFSYLQRPQISGRELSFPTRKIAMALPKNVQNQLKMTSKQLKSTQNGSKSAKNAQNRVGSSKFSRTLGNVAVELT